MNRLILKFIFLNWENKLCSYFSMNGWVVTSFNDGLQQHTVNNGFQKNPVTMFLFCGWKWITWDYPLSFEYNVFYYVINIRFNITYFLLVLRHSLLILIISMVGSLYLIVKTDLQKISVKWNSTSLSKIEKIGRNLRRRLLQDLCPIVGLIWKKLGRLFTIPSKRHKRRWLKFDRYL